MDFVVGKEKFVIYYLINYADFTEIYAGRFIRVQDAHSVNYRNIKYLNITTHTKKLTFKKLN